MLNLTPHRRLQIPNGLAIFAAILLIGSSVAGIGSNQDDLAGVHESDITAATKDIESEINVISDTIKQSPHVLRLGLRLFQR